MVIPKRMVDIHLKRTEAAWILHQLLGTIFPGGFIKNIAGTAVRVERDFIAEVAAQQL
jgi:hypothetical protein